MKIRRLFQSQRLSEMKGILQINIQALCWLPHSSYAPFLHVLSVSYIAVTTNMFWLNVKGLFVLGIYNHLIFVVCYCFEIYFRLRSLCCKGPVPHCGLGEDAQRGGQECQVKE